MPSRPLDQSLAGALHTKRLVTAAKYPLDTQGRERELEGLEWVRAAWGCREAGGAGGGCWQGAGGQWGGSGITVGGCGEL